jgi:ABC-type Fe3+ transport system permease subunit
MRKGERWVQRLEVIVLAIVGVLLAIGYIISRVKS